MIIVGVMVGCEDVLYCFISRRVLNLLVDKNGPRTDFYIGLIVILLM